MGRRSARWVRSSTTAVLLGTAVGLVVNVATATIEPLKSWYWWPWAVWAAVVLLTAALVGVQYAQSRSPAAGPDDEVVADLAARFEDDWSAEAVRREVTRPAPVSVAWSSTGRPRMAAGRAAVLGTGRAETGRSFRCADAPTR